MTKRLLQRYDKKTTPANYSSKKARKKHASQPSSYIQKNGAAALKIFASIHKIFAAIHKIFAAINEFIYSLKYTKSARPAGTLRLRRTVPFVYFI